MPVQLIAIDLDGTLLTSRKSISRRTHTALAAARDQGIHIVLATARPPRSVRGYYEALKLATPQINYNGALIWDEPRRRIIEHTPLETEVCRKVINVARKMYPEILVSVEILDKWYTDHFSDVPEYATETSKQHFTPDFIGPIDAFLTVPPTKLMLLGDPEWIATLEKQLPRKFGDDIAHTRSDPFLLQINHPSVNKGSAVAAVAKRLGVARENIMAIGDAPNDLSMLVYAGVPVVMGNAWDQVKSAGRAIVPDNDHDGVGIAIEELVLSAD
jgi:Cof subfamily protein (haloacid dehalogenase superfamily)